MSYKKIEVIKVSIVLKCDQCEKEIDRPAYTITPECESDNYQPVHLCSSVCIKFYFKRWAENFRDGYGARAMFDYVIGGTEG